MFQQQQVVQQKYIVFILKISQQQVLISDEVGTGIPFYQQKLDTWQLVKFSQNMNQIVKLLQKLSLVLLRAMMVLVAVRVLEDYVWVIGTKQLILRVHFIQLHRCLSDHNRVVIKEAVSDELPIKYTIRLLILPIRIFSASLLGLL